MYNLKNIKNDELLSNTKDIAARERKLQLKLLYHLQEIEARKLYLKIGFSSLYDYVCQELKYSGSSAYRRIQAMRLLKEVPEVEEKLADGSINLTTAVQIQSFFRSTAKETISLSTSARTGSVVANPVNADSVPKRLSREEKKELVATLENKSTREVEKHLLGLQGNNFFPKEKVRQVTEDLVEIKILIPEELKQILDELKLKLSHVNPNMTYQELIQYLAQKAIKGANPRKPKDSSQNTQHAAEPAPVVNARYVSQDLRRKIFQRDLGCCAYTDVKSGRKCGSRFQLQIDHIKPFALGGKTEESNLRLLCANHNRYRAEKTFGRRC